MSRALFSSVSCLALMAALVAGCAIGPDFSTPSAPDVTAYDSTAVPETTADGAQTLQIGQDIPAQWWALFHSSALNALVTQAIKDNPDLASAQASLRVAQDNLAAGGAAYFPKIDGTFASQRAKTSINSGADTLYTLHNASVGVSYDLDVWGKTRRSVELLQAQAEAARFQSEAAYLSLTANVVTTAVQEAALREQIAAMKEVVTAQEKTLELLKARFEAGAVAKSAVLAQQSALASARAALSPLEHQGAVARHALAALVGQAPAQHKVSTLALADLTLPKQIPVTLPSRLVEQRPDVRAAQETLHAASAAIGVAEAARLPNIILSGDIGSMAHVLDKLFSPGGGFWSLGVSTAETLFDAGALANKEQAARDAYEASAAQYRKTVLVAFQDVADALHALQSDAQLLNAKTEADKAAADSLALVQAQFDAGAVSKIDLLGAQQAAQQTKAALAQATAQRYADTAALFAALGGGWWNRSTETAAVQPTSSEKGAQ